MPAIIMTRLAIHHPAQSKGLGRALFVDAAQHVASVAQGVGVRALLMHVNSDDACAC